MIAHDELKRLLRLLHKHEDILVAAHLETNGVVDESATDLNTIESLTDARLLWQPSSDEPARLIRELSGLFERILRDPRRLTLDADIGGFVINIENNVNRYKEALRAGLADDATFYLGQIERLVDQIRSSLLDSSGQLWNKINSEFGYVNSLALKIKENEAVLQQARRLNDSLELIRVSEVDELVGNDYQLRRYLQRWLLDAVESCRMETVDAIHKLNKLLFEYRKQQRLGRLIEAFYRHYQSTPGYIPLDYTDAESIPEVLNYAAPLLLIGHAYTDDPRQEVALAEIVDGLRKERPATEVVADLMPVEVLPEDPPITRPLEALSLAVEEFFLSVAESTSVHSAVAHRPSEHVEPDAEIWLYAVIARFNAMDLSERSLFNIEYLQTEDLVFNGRHLVQDVLISLNREVLSPSSQKLSHHVAN